MSKLYECEFYEKNDKKIIIKYINKNKNKILIPDQFGSLPIHYYCMSDCEKSIEIINSLIKYDKNNLLIPDNGGYLPIHLYCWCRGEKSKEIINLLINYDKKNLLIPDNGGYLPILLYCRNVCKKSIEIIDYLLYNYDINNIDYILNSSYVGYYLYKVYNWVHYKKELFLYMLITKLQRLIKIYLIKRKLS